MNVEYSVSVTKYFTGLTLDEAMKIIPKISGGDGYEPKFKLKEEQDYYGEGTGFYSITFCDGGVGGLDNLDSILEFAKQSFEHFEEDYKIDV